MNENQEKPAKKWYKQWLIIFTIAFVILITCGIPLYAMMYGGGTWPPAKQAAYNTVKEELQNAVQYYQHNNNGTLPTLNGTMTINSSVCQILDICSLLISQDGTLRAVPDSLWSGNSSNDDNCNAGCEGCLTTNHYVWTVDNNGSVYSTCIGEDCEANAEDGYQGVWP